MKSVYIAFIAISIIAIQGCSKYSDGPGFSLISKKDRLCHDWVLDYHLLNENDVTDAEQTVKFSIEKDGTYSMTTYVNAMGQLQGTYSHGTWTFEDSKAQLYLYEDVNEDPTHMYTIKELRSKSLQIVEKFSSINATHTYRFIRD